ncbi:MAG TPA: hypothetical protein VFB20_04495 [Burkholderiales bacterium]|nr:hypothetical protein [Burkholderiales bacterium]
MSATRNAAAALGAVAAMLCAAAAGAADDPADGAATMPIQNAQDRVQSLQDVQQMTEKKDQAGREHAEESLKRNAQQHGQKRPSRPGYPER